MHIHTIQLNIEKLIGGTNHMDALEFGAYMSLLVCAYQTDNNLPDDDKRLARMAKCSPRQWSKVKPTIIKKFTVKNLVWLHKRVQKDLEKYEKLSRKNKANALKKNKTPKPVGKPKAKSGTANTSNNHQVTNNNIIYIGENQYTPDMYFEVFWNEYPNTKPKGNKVKAKEKFIEIMKGTIDYEQFHHSTKEYRKFCDAGNYNQHATTWLNQSGWQTDWGAQANSGGGQQSGKSSAAKAAIMRGSE